VETAARAQPRLGLDQQPFLDRLEIGRQRRLDQGPSRRSRFSTTRQPEGDRRLGARMSRPTPRTDRGRRAARAGCGGYIAAPTCLPRPIIIIFMSPAFDRAMIAGVRA